MDWGDFRLSTRLQLPAALAETIYARIAEIDTVRNTYKLANKLLPQTMERLTQSVSTR